MGAALSRGRLSQPRDRAASRFDGSAFASIAQAPSFAETHAHAVALIDQRGFTKPPACIPARSLHVEAAQRFELPQHGAASG